MRTDSNSTPYSSARDASQPPSDYCRGTDGSYKGRSLQSNLEEVAEEDAHSHGDVVAVKDGLEDLLEPGEDSI